MPVHKTKGGYKYGNTGKTYKDKKLAIKQALAIAYSKAKKKDRKPTQEEIVAEITGSEESMNKYAAADNKYIDTVVGILRDHSPASLRRSGVADDSFKWDYMPAATMMTHEGFSADSGLGREFMSAVKAIPENVGQKRTKAGKLKAVKANQKVIGDITTDALKEFAANDNLKDALLLRGPSYLGSILAGAAVGRLLSGKKKRWWGYGLGGLIGAGLNFARRKGYYGGVNF